MSRSRRPKLGLEHIVVTSVDRDDLPDGGAGQFVKVIEALRREHADDHDRDPDARFPRQDARRGRGDRRRAARRLQPQPRDRAAALPDDPPRRALLRLAAAARGESSATIRLIFTKSGIMLGLGEERLEVHQVMDDMRCADVDFLTMGQYLQPTPRHAKVAGFRHARRRSTPTARSPGPRASCRSPRAR